MELTWRDAISTLTTGAAVTLEQAHFRGWEWPLMASTRWAVAALLVFWAINLTISYMIGRSWAAIEYTLGILNAGVGAYGLVTGSNDALALLMLGIVAMWLIAVVDHIVRHQSQAILKR